MIRLKEVMPTGADYDHGNVIRLAGGYVEAESGQVHNRYAILQYRKNEANEWEDIEVDSA